MRQREQFFLRVLDKFVILSRWANSGRSILASKQHSKDPDTQDIMKDNKNSSSHSSVSASALSPSPDTALAHILSHLKQHAEFANCCGIPAIPQRPPAAVLPQRQPAPFTGQSLETLQYEVDTCRRCSLHATRTQSVFGSGNPRATVMVIGDAPDAEEDRQGQSLAGPAGELLEKILAAVHIDRDDVYVTTLVKCHPPDNRSPEREEIAICADCLERQIDCVQPALLCALGPCAARTLLASEEPLAHLRGRFFKYRGIPVMPTYAPAFLLHHPEDKRAVWHDMQQVETAYRKQITSKEATA